MATLTPQTSTSAGITPTQNAVSASDKFANDGSVVGWWENGSGALLTVTVVSQQTVGDQSLAVADQTFTVANGAKKVAGPFKKSIFNDGSGDVTIQHDQTSSVTVALFKAPYAG